MKHKNMLLALAVVSAAMFALPAVASAEWTVAPNNAAFTVSNHGAIVLSTHGGTTFTCTAVSGNGAFDGVTGTKGTVTLTFHGCKESIFGSSCTSAGNPAGTISTVANIPFTTVYLEDNKKKPGIKLTGTGATEQLATYTCNGGFIHTTLNGSLIGELESACGATAKTHALRFESLAHGTQQYSQNTATGTKTDLTSTVASTVFGTHATETTGLKGTGTLTSLNNVTVNCV